MFGKKKRQEQAAAAATDALDADVAQLRERLAAAEHSKLVLETRLEEMSTRLGSIDDRLAGADIRVDAMSQRLGEVEGRSAELDEVNARLRELSERVATDPASEASTPPLAAAPVGTPPPPPPPPAPADGTELDHDLDERFDELRRRVDELTEQMTSVDSRVTSVSTELANQLTELSTDIERLYEQGPTTDTSEIEARLGERIDAAMDDVVDSTERLAAEQARYEIQFRADLAELADRLRRPGSSSD